MPEHGPFSAAERPPGAETAATLVGDLLLSPQPPARAAEKCEAREPGVPGKRSEEPS